MNLLLRRTASVAALLLAPLFLHAADAVHPIALPGASPAGIGMDYIAFNAATNTVWVPAGNTGAVDVIDVPSGTIRQITGFATKEVTFRERKRTLGPSAVSFGAGRAYIGNRGDSSICAFDQKTLKKESCQVLDAMPDGVSYVGATNEVWVTTPRDKSIRVLDASTLHEKAKLAFDGNPEGFAVDGKGRRFFTNLEDKDRTLVIDLATHKTVATWMPGCGEDGPHGLRYDESTGHLFVACSAKLEVLNAGGDGAVLSSVDTGDGVDDFDYVPSTKLVYVGASRAAKLTVARDDAKGHLTVVATVPTVAGSRNPTVASNGTVYLTHSASSEIIAVAPPVH